jgi:hypothetical protein
VKPILRICAALATGVATLYFVFWLSILIPVPVGRVPVFRITMALACALLAARSIWRRGGGISSSRGLAESVVAGALVTGVVGFVIGFVGPMIVSPDANQGPMLGIFITGPLGVLLGAVGGGIYWRAHRGPAAASARDGTDAV